MMSQLRYRFEREYLAHRSCVRWMTEEGRMEGAVVLVVTRFIQLDSDTFDDATTRQMELSDGWYSLKATLDPHLTAQRRIQPGVKLILSNLQVCSF